MSPALAMSETPSMTMDPSIPPWKKELILRKNALARTVEPNLSLICPEVTTTEGAKRGEQKQMENCRPLAVKLENKHSPIRRTGPNRQAAVVEGESVMLEKREEEEEKECSCDSPEDQSHHLARRKGERSILLSQEQKHHHHQFKDEGRDVNKEGIEWDTFEWEEQDFVAKRATSAIEVVGVINPEIAKQFEVGGSKKKSPERVSSSATGKRSYYYFSREQFVQEQDDRSRKITTFASALAAEIGQSEEEDQSSMGEDPRTVAVTGERANHGYRHHHRHQENDITDHRSSASNMPSKNTIARLYRTKDANNPSGAARSSTKYTTPSQLDSDGTFGSGGDSDSSEEIHYGPGFVSRLKSRYMSVALRSSSSRGSVVPTSLRRTASLENFLDKENDVEMRKPTSEKGQHKHHHHHHHHNHRHSDHGSAATGMYTKSSRPKAPSATSNHISRARNRQHHHQPMSRAQSIEVLSYQDHRHASRPMRSESVQTEDFSDDDQPPPLPPKSANIDAVVNSLGKDKVVLFESKTTSKKVMQVAPAQHQQQTARKQSPSTSRRPLYQRRSSSQLFGVEEKELPAPDIVKETRKIFESRSGGPVANSHRGLGHKSRSASSLYSSRSQSVDRSSEVGRRYLQRKNSEENIPSVSSRRNSIEIVSKPTLPAKPAHLIAPQQRKAINNSGPAELQEDESSKTFQIPPLRPVSKNMGVSKNEHKNFVEIEEGVRQVSQDSIDRIRQSSSSVSFNFKNDQQARGPLAINSTPDVENHHQPRQVGVIKPITRGSSREQVKPRERVEKPKEVLYIEKEPLPALPAKPVKSWKTTPSAVEPKKVEKPKPVTRENGLSHQKKPTVSEVKTTPKIATENKVNSLVKKAEPSVNRAINDNTNKSPPKVAEEKPQKNSDGDIVLQLESVKKDEPSNENPSPNSHSNGVNFRDEWKKRNSEMNSMVFNFVNSQKEVTHIENDGRDISKRIRPARNLNKDSGVVLLDGVAGSSSVDQNDSDSDTDNSDIDVHRYVPPCNMVFVGANVDTGKSSIRSRPKPKKMSITFSQSLTEIYEYPSGDHSSSVTKEDNTSSALKSNSAIGFKGGLGSYTPSKIQMTETPFQLGVSRASSSSSSKNVSKQKGNDEQSEEVLRPIEDATSWSGSSSTSDLLF